MGAPRLQCFNNTKISVFSCFQPFPTRYSTISVQWTRFDPIKWGIRPKRTSYKLHSTKRKSPISTIGNTVLAPKICNLLFGYFLFPYLPLCYTHFFVRLTHTIVHTLWDFPFKAQLCGQQKNSDKNHILKQTIRQFHSFWYFVQPSQY